MLVSIIAGIILYLSIEHFINGYLDKYTLWFVLGGIALIIFAHQLKFIHVSITRSLGLVALTMGSKPYLIKYIPLYPWIFLIGALGVIIFADKIADLIVKNGIS